MKKYIITYGDEKCKSARMRFIQNALNLNIFDEVIGYSEKDISSELQRSSIIKEKLSFIKILPYTYIPLFNKE